MTVTSFLCSVLPANSPWKPTKQKARAQKQEMLLTQHRNFSLQAHWTSGKDWECYGWGNYCVSWKQTAKCIKIRRAVTMEPKYPSNVECWWLEAMSSQFFEEGRQLQSTLSATFWQIKSLSGVVPLRGRDLSLMSVARGRYPMTGF